MIKPMLAKKFENYEAKLRYPVWVQPKLDGVRMIWDADRAYSRTGKPLSVPERILKELRAEFNGWVLDGELYSHDKPFEECAGEVRRLVNSTDETGLRYVVFDVVESTIQTERIKKMNAKLESRADTCSVYCLDSRLVYSSPELWSRMDFWIAQGFEGAMVRNPDAFYQQKRTKDLLKLKRWIFAEARIVGFVEGKGKHKGRLGALVVGHGSEWTCKVGTGFSDRERDDFWENRHQNVFDLRRVWVKYQELTKYGVPRFPSWVGLSTG